MENSNLLGGAQVHDISSGQTGVIREESVLGSALHVNNVVVLHGFRVLVSGLSHHDRSIDVNRVGRILDGTDDLRSEHLLDTHDVALGSITDENLRRINKVVVKNLGDLFTQKALSLFGTVSTVTFLGTKLLGSLDQSVQNVRRDRHGGVTNSKRDNTVSHLGVLFEVGISATANFWEEVTTGQFGKVFVTLDLGNGNLFGGGEEGGARGLLSLGGKGISGGSQGGNGKDDRGCELHGCCRII